MSTVHTPHHHPDEIIEALLEAFVYDPETGVIKHNLDRPMDHFRTENGYKKWRTRATNQPVVGSINNHGYLTIFFNHPLLKKRRVFKSHHIAWLLHHREWPKSCLDHINNDRTDNRISNLRIVTHRQNGHNRLDQSKFGVGVYPVRDNYGAKIRILGGQYHIGTYTNPDIAATAYDCLLMSISDNHNTGPNGLGRCDLEKAIASVPRLAGKVNQIHRKVQEARKGQ